MYGLVLMAAMGGTPDVATFHPRVAGCTGCCGGTVAASCHGCCGGFLGHRTACYGCCGGYMTFATHSCHGCGGGFLGHHKHHSNNCCGGYSCFGSCSGCSGFAPSAYIYPTYAVPFYYGVPGIQSAPVVVPEAEEKKKDEKKKDEKKGASLKFNLPAGAALFVDGARTSGDGEERSFFTPPLATGQKYFYDVRAEIAIDGKMVVEEKRVIVEAGADIRESFPKMIAAVAASRTVAGK